MPFNEADTRAKLIDPKLRAAGWDESRIRREFYYTQGRVYLVGDEHRRKLPKKVDYLLQEPNGLKLALVEAKDESHCKPSLALGCNSSSSCSAFGTNLAPEDLEREDQECDPSGLWVGRKCCMEGRICCNKARQLTHATAPRRLP